MATALDAIETLDLRIHYENSAWSVECRALKSLGVGETIAAAAAAAWAPLAAYAAALEGMPDGALKAAAVRERAMLRALHAALTDLGAK